MAAIDWNYWLDRLDKRPMSILLGLSLGMNAWSFIGWRDEVKDHKEDLRKSNTVLERTNEIQYRMLDIMQTKNQQQWQQKPDSAGSQSSSR
jgi:hypothetical protein